MELAIQQYHQHLQHPLNNAAPITNEQAMRIIHDAMQRNTQNVHAWHFDIFQFASISDGYPILVLAYMLLHEHNMHVHFNLSNDTIVQYLIQVETAYIRDNTYHNHVHAADVLQAMHYMMQQCGIAFSPEEWYIAINASILHDVGHPGKHIDMYHVNQQSILESMYGQVATMEHHHAALGLAIMRASNMLPMDNCKAMTDKIEQLIFATDLALQKPFMEQIGNAELALPWRVMLFAIKVADVANAARNTDTTVHWSTLVAEELNQMNDIPKLMVGFINHIVIPLLQASPMESCTKLILEQAMANKRLWNH